MTDATFYDRMHYFFKSLSTSASDLQLMLNKSRQRGEVPHKILIPKYYYNGVPFEFADVRFPVVMTKEVLRVRNDISRSLSEAKEPTDKEMREDWEY